MRSELEDALRDLEKLQTTAAEWQRNLQGIRLSASDPHQWVSVVTDAAGAIVDLKISDDARPFPQLIGRAVTEAVQRAKVMAQERTEQLRPASLPALPGAAETRATALALLREHAESSESLLAETTASAHWIAELEDLERLEITKEIGRNAGSVHIRAATGEMSVELAPTAIRNVGVQRIAAQLLVAIREAEAEARDQQA